MSIQVLGLRPYIDRKTGREKLTDKFLGEGWRFQDVADVFNEAHVAKLLGSIPEREQWNLFWTVADCFEGEKRRLKEQHVIPFDIDGIELTSEDTLREDALKVAEAVCLAIGVRPEDCGAIFSGHGVQVFVRLDAPFTSEDYIEQTRPHYVAICDKIQLRLEEQGIKGRVDPSVWSPSRLMRLPNTMNIKKDKPNRKSFILLHDLRPSNFSLEVTSGLKDFLEPQVLRVYPKPDIKAVCEGCAFLKYCNDNQDKISEPQWYAQMGVEAFFGEENWPTVHEHCSKHPDYNWHETELKLKQAAKASGPRTCSDIGLRWDGCKDCAYYGKVTSPILIKGPDYIQTMDTGFRKIGERGPGIIHYDDLCKYFNQSFQYLFLDTENTFIVYRDNHWQEMSDVRIEAWAAKHVFPSPSYNEMAEFRKRLARRDKCITNRDEMFKSAANKLNFANCVVDIITKETFPHSADFGFFNILPFAYDPRATAPVWEKFLLDVTEGDEDYAQGLKEFGGYAISGDECWTQKALLIIGDGRNGKNVYMETLAEVAGAGNWTGTSLANLRNDNTRAMSVNALFNYSDETNPRSFFDSDFFKSMVSGGVMSAKRMYKDVFQYKNKTKLILALNDDPDTRDLSYGLMRRLLIVRFRVRFSRDNENDNPFIKEQLLAELPGIANSLIEAYANLKEKREFTCAKKSELEVQMLSDEMDVVKTFMETHMVKKAGAKVASQDLYVAYSEFSRNVMGDRPLISNHFFRRLRKLLPREYFSKSGNHRYIEGFVLDRQPTNSDIKGEEF